VILQFGHNDCPGKGPERETDPNTTFSANMARYVDEARSIGATPDNIVADASRKLAALAAYTEHLTTETNEFVSLSEQKIALLQQQIEETRRSIEAAQTKLTSETGLCVAESHKLDEVLEFFSLDVPPSAYAAPQA